jgi:hypothetical protein
MTGEYSAVVSKLGKNKFIKLCHLGNPKWQLDNMTSQDVNSLIQFYNLNKDYETQDCNYCDIGRVPNASSTV